MPPWLANESTGLDWSALMTRVQEDLKKAEGELRLVHVNLWHKREAYMHIERARIGLKLLSGWCDG